jgi:hypothetical protein
MDPLIIPAIALYCISFGLGYAARDYVSRRRRRRGGYFATRRSD